MGGPLRLLMQRLAQAARLACGVPDYEAYLAHLRTHHPERTPLDRAAFVRDRLHARYRRGASRCC